MKRPARSTPRCARALVTGIAVGVISAGAATAAASARGGRSEAVSQVAAPASHVVLIPHQKSPEVVLKPTYVEVSNSFATQLGVQFVPTSATTDVNSLGLPAPVRNVFGSSVLLLHDEQFLPKNGVDQGNPDTAPSGSLRLEWSIDYFATDAGALAVERARDANLTSEGFGSVHSSRLAAQGITAFARTQPNTPLASQIWYSVYGNAVLAVADTGKFAPGALQSDQLTLYTGLHKLLHGVPTLKLLVEPKLTLPQAGQAYLGAIEMVIMAEPIFMDQAQRWDAATTGAQAQADAQPLINALGNTEGRVLTIASRYPPARTGVLATVGAIEVLKAELSDLGRLRTPGTSGWLQTYEAVLARLTAASNQVRSTLGLPAAR